MRGVKSDEGGKSKRGVGSDRGGGLREAWM